jgi:predicted SAM-dependent methyltransferase
MAGWVLTDKDILNITQRDSFAKYWKPNTRSIFLAEHVWEHLTLEESSQAIKNCFEFLRPKGGRLRIAVPDGFHPNSDYIEHVRPGGTGAGAEDHKILYNYLSLSSSLEEAGFQTKLLEYWNEKGEFNFQEWSLEDGHIFRSKRYDKRNQDGSLNYTSLIIDAIKL